MNTSATKPPPSGNTFEHDVLAFIEDIRAFVRARVYHPQDAEDLLQDILVKLFRSRTALRDPARLRAWAFRTARTSIADHFRRRRPAEPLPATLTDEAEFPDEAAARMHRSVRHFARTLPEKYRLPLERAVFGGQSIRDIAVELRLGESAVKSRLARARAMLRERLLACCQFEFDPYGKIIDLRRRGPCVCDTEDTSESTAAPRRPRRPVVLRPARPGDRPPILALLRSARLPTDDITPNAPLHFIVAVSRDGGADGVAGTAAIEPHGTVGLLRSVAVAPEYRGHGLGRRLVTAAEALAASLRLDTLYLLTTDGADWFNRLGYRRLDRAQAPCEITASPQFHAICPAGATLMMRRLHSEGRL